MYTQKINIVIGLPILGDKNNESVLFFIGEGYLYRTTKDILRYILYLPLI